VAPEGLDALVASLRSQLARTLLALDFDGTLAPIVPDPATSRPVPGTVEVLHELTGQGVTVGLVTGRDARTVLALSGFEQLPGLLVEALYGAEQWSAGTLTSPDTPASMLELRRRLPAVLAAQDADPKVWIEDKRLSLVVHARLAADPEAALDPLRAPVAELGAQLGLAVYPGNGIIELRLPSDDKGQALLRLVEQSHATHVLYIGDDLGDIPAFETVARLRTQGLTAWSVAVSSDPSTPVSQAADVALDAPGDVLELLRALAGS
jgi:trehalose 6-phosphate phosphatase